MERELITNPRIHYRRTTSSMHTIVLWKPVPKRGALDLFRACLLLSACVILQQDNLVDSPEVYGRTGSIVS